jgi:hypothetical protein
MANVQVVRQISNVLGLAVSPSPATGYMFAGGASAPTSGQNLLNFIPRVQSVSIATNIAREDVNQYGQLDRIDTLITTPPTTTLNFDYYLLDGYAESLLGFAASGQQSFVSGLIDGTQSEKNYFLGVAPEGVDLIGSSPSSANNLNVIGIGNGVVSNYTMTLQVGQIPRASVTIEGTNQQAYNGSTGKASPAIDPNTSLQVVGPLWTLPTMSGYTGASVQPALRPGDVRIGMPRTGGFTDYTSGIGQFIVQGVTMSVPIALDYINQLGSPYPIAKRIRFPVNCTLSVDAMQGDIAEDNLASVFCSDDPINIIVTLDNPSCTRTGPSAITVNFNQAKFVSRDYTSSIGQSSTVRYTFTNQLAGITAGYAGRGIVFNGTYGRVPTL